jgi:nuclear GTP-binding protein
VADLDATAKVILQDWNEGRIPFYTTPPAPKILKSEIVTEWGKGTILFFISFHFISFQRQ